jgi:glycosyltransferase involved in cell wall biosynthesis
VRIVAFGTYRLWEQPRVQVLFEGLREHGHELVECNVPLQVDTAERVKAARQPLRAPLVAARVARAWRDLWRKAKEAPEPDVVLVPYMGQFDVHLARRRFKSKPIVLDHYLFFKDTAIDRGTTFKPELAALDRIDKSAIRAADLVFVDSEGHRELLPEPIRSEAFTVYIGTPNEWFHEPEARAEGPVRVVFFGIYTPLQGAPVIGEAIRLLDPDPEKVRFTMAGRGQDLTHTKELAGDSPAVEWIDWVERDELPALVFEHDLCLGIFSPGAKGMRVIPNKVFQGAAAGCAIVTSDSVSQREALGDAARFVEPGDPQALADALRWLIADRDRVWTLRQAAYRRAVEAFAPAAVVEPLHARLQAGVRKRR